MVIFLSITFVVFGMLTFFVGVHLTAGLFDSPLLSRCTWTALIFGDVLLWTAPILSRTRRSSDLPLPSWMKALNLGAYSFMSVLVLLLFFFLCLDLLTIVPILPSSVLMHAPGGIFFVSVVLMLWGFRTARRGPSVVETVVLHAGLKENLDGLRIVQISDLHVGANIGRDYVERVVQQTLALKPDLIVLTGDIVDGSLDHHQDDLAPLKKLTAPLGIHYVTGNHEYFWGAEKIQNYFRSIGFQVLNNEHRALNHKTSTLVIVGVPDIMSARIGTGGPDPHRAIQGAPPSDFTIFLTHQPNTVSLAEKIPIDLQLSGHTHGGQFFPVHWLVGLFNRYSKGLHRHNGKFWVYVNQGTGFWGPPNRLGVRAELSLLTLKKLVGLFLIVVACRTVTAQAQSKQNPADGARNVMAVIYQNCDAVRAAPRLSTEHVPGTGFAELKHSDGTVFRRIVDQKAFALNHPYLPSGPLEPSLCFDVRKQTPIYNYGGTPKDISAGTKKILSLHQKAGTGNPSNLGIDCSSFVTAAHLVAGLKLSTAPLSLSEEQFDVFDSRQFTNAPKGTPSKEKNRTDCLKPLKISSKITIQAGDVLAWPGHVVMIESVGTDPLAIGNSPKKFTAKAPDCSTTGNPEHFDFVIIQSSAGEDGIGVNRMNARDFFTKVVPAKGLELQKIAQAVCFAKQKKKPLLRISRVVLTENGISKNTFTLLRHRVLQGESVPACQTQPIALEHSACVASCLKSW